MAAPSSGESLSPERGRAASQEGESRHASWLELFFDLMAVAGVAALAHLLHEDVTWHGIATYTVAFAAFWMIWAVYTAYGNIKGDDVHTITMIIGMAALGLMTASVGGFEEGHGVAFAGAFVIARLVATRPWSRTTLVVDLPVVQGTVTVLPWIASIWAPDEWRLWLWALGLAGDVWILLGVEGDRWLRRSQERLDFVRERLASAPSRRSRAVPLRMTAAATHSEHLAERMGLFVLIVLGEGLVQIVDTAAETEWGPGLLGATAGGFVLVIALWFASVQHGNAGIPLLDVDVIPVRFMWLAHMVSTGSLVMAASMLGSVVARPNEALEHHELWVLVAALGVHTVLTVCVHAGSGHWMAAARSGLPLSVAIAVSALWVDAPATAIMWTLAVGALLTSMLAARRGGRHAAAERLDQE